MTETALASSRTLPDPTAGRRAHDPISLVVEAFDPERALAALELISPGGEFLALAEDAQDAVERLDEEGEAAAADRETLSLVGARALVVDALTRPGSPDEVRRRARAYSRQRCDPRVATILALALELDRRLLRMGIRELA